MGIKSYGYCCLIFTNEETNLEETASYLPPTICVLWVTVHYITFLCMGSSVTFRAFLAVWPRHSFALWDLGNLFWLPCLCAGLNSPLLRLAASPSWNTTHHLQPTMIHKNRTNVGCSWRSNYHLILVWILFLKCLDSLRLSSSQHRDKEPNPTSQWQSEPVPVPVPVQPFGRRLYRQGPMLYFTGFLIWGMEQKKEQKVWLKALVSVSEDLGSKPYLEPY